MFKKIKYITLAILLVISTVGVTISKHYCSNELVSISIVSSADYCCDEPGSDCCHNEDTFVILKADFSAPSIIITSIVELELFVSIYTAVTEILLDIVTSSNIEVVIKPPLETHQFLAKIQAYLL